MSIYANFTDGADNAREKVSEIGGESTANFDPADLLRQFKDINLQPADQRAETEGSLNFGNIWEVHTVSSKLEPSEASFPENREKPEDTTADSDHSHRWSDSREKLFDEIGESLSDSLDGVEDSDQETSFQIQVGISRLAEAEKSRSQATKKLDEARKRLAQKWSA